MLFSYYFQVALERVLGFTVNNSCGLATDPNTGQIAYPAGCVVVLYNPRRNKQTHLVNTSKKAITCLAFSKDGRYLATGESGHQPSVRLWDLEEMTQIAEFQGHKFGINAVVTGIAFSEDSSTFVTVGNRHVKFWNMDSSKSRIKETVPLKGHSGILGEQKNNFFCGVCCGCGATANKTYAITRSGLLCEFNDNRLLDKWVELRTTSATCIVAQEHHVFVGCANGIVRVFNAGSLNYVTTLPRPHHLGVDVTSGQDPSSVTSAPADAVYPDTVAISIDDEACKLTCIYNDHSLYIWDIHDIKRIGKCRSFLYHSAAIWGVEVYPLLEQGVDLLPRGSFFTCSSDDTIRIWNVDPHMSTDTPYKRNIYSNELLKVIYTDQDLCNIVEKEFNPAGKTDKTDTQYQDNHGVRSLTVSNDGKHLASGDREGNIRIHELKFMEELHTLEAHDSEVLSLEFSQPSLGKNILASTSRDRLIHVFDCDNDYELLQTLDDHSAAITSVKFYENENHQLGMLSCGMDKSLLFRGAQMEPEFQFVMTRHLVGKTTLYDMCLDPRQKFVATACQDRNIRIYNLKNGKYKKSYSGSTGSDGTLLRLAQDRSGAYVVASCSDKNVGIFDFFTGECMANMLGHSEVVTGIRFTNDMKHIISVSGDGNDTYLNEDDFLPATSVIDNLLTTPDKNANLLTDPGSQHKPDFRFSVGQLPSWAKRQVLLCS
ncbi:hypothetical protein LSH36_561g03000 [Paralvinella palmiformis]|uniref:MABP1/WDR62 second WD40 domain-containing protein n=1 Tax=Paralvinella palmiformis TaxID=53620 RepID=A0AAD9MXE6_9ANNE|nr:hypothetical protein LSH36_561g03000 [Paralvinella palmiformis]